MPRMNRIRRRSIAAAVTFALAAVSGVVGGKLTGRLTLALVVFAALVAVGTAVTFWMERTAGSAANDDGPSSRLGPVDLRGAKGVQVGDFNWQENRFVNDDDE